MSKPTQAPPPGWAPDHPMYVTVTEPPPPKGGILGIVRSLFAGIGSAFTPPKESGRRKR